MQCLGLTQLIDRQLPALGSNRGYRQGTSYHLEKEKPLMELLGCGQSPGAKTLGNWLRRVGRSAQSALPDGVSVSHVRIDVATYQAVVINHAMESGMGFAIRAKMDSTVKEAISEIKDFDWRPLVHRDGSESDKEQICNTCM